MNSFSTSADTLAHLARYAERGLAAADEVELMQNQVPKIDAATPGAGGVAGGSVARVVSAGSRRPVSGAGRQRLAGPAAGGGGAVCLCLELRQPRRGAGPGAAVAGSRRAGRRS